MSGRTKFGARMLAAREQAGLTQLEVRARLKISQGTISELENSANGSSRVAEFAALYKVDPMWLATGKGEMHLYKEAPMPTTTLMAAEPYHYAAVRRVKFKLSAGISGFEVAYQDEDRAPIFFRRDWIASKGFDPDKLFAVEINGNSMEPSLFDGDYVVVNTGDVTPRDGEVFALNYEGELVIKRLVHEGDAWYMRSDNQDKIRYADKRCDDRASIIGKVVHKQSERI